jgi:hypothetical protein
MKKSVSIHQPNFLPWLGFFYKISQSTDFIILDNVEFTKGSFINRNRIKSSHGKAQWLTIPVNVSKSERQKINTVEVDITQKWVKNHQNTLRTCYSKSPYFQGHFDKLAGIYELETRLLINFNVHFLKYLMRVLNISGQQHFASDLIGNDTLKSNELLIQLCKNVGAEIYIAGEGSKKYMDNQLFKDRGIEVKYINYQHPVYPQLYGNFISHLSVIDLIFNCGPESTHYLYHS